MEMHPASHPYHGEITLEDEVLNGLLRSPQIYGSLLNIQQDRLNF